MTKAIEDAYDTTKYAVFHCMRKYDSSINHMLFAAGYFVSSCFLIWFSATYIPMAIISAVVFIILVCRMIYLKIMLNAASEDFDEANKDFLKMINDRTSLSVHTLKKYELSEEEHEKEIAKLKEKALEMLEESKQNEVERKKKFKEIEAKFEAGIAEEERKKKSNSTSDYVSPIVSNSILTVDSGSSSCDSSSSDGGSSSCSSD